MRDYYKILGIRPDATREEIKDAWNFSVKAFHPDKFAGSSPRQQAVAQERTKAINEAYEVLSDPVRKANYDWQYARERSTNAAAPPPSQPSPPPPSTAQRPAHAASAREGTRPRAPRKPIFNFRRTFEFLKNCVRITETGIANLIRKLSKSVVGTATFFASLMTKMSKASAEILRWFYGKRKSLGIGMIMLVVGVGLGIWLSPHQHSLWVQLRSVFTMASGETSTMEALAPPVGETERQSPSLPLMTAAERSERTKAIARSKFEQAQQALRQRDFATALKLVGEADQADPNQPATLNLRGEILMQQQQFDQAEAAFKKAAKLDPKLSEAQFNLAQIPFKKKDYAKARERFETLYKRTPGGDKNQAAELFKFRIYLTLLLEGKESRAHAMMEEFQFTGDTPALYYAWAAWEYKHNNAEKAAEWTTSANKIYSAALNNIFADPFYDVGWVQRPEGSTAPAVASDTSNIGTSQTESGPAVVGSSPNSTPSEFANYAMKLREQGMTQIPPLTESTSPSLAIQRYPWKTNVVTTVFWVGEKQGNGKMSHGGESAWDANWASNYGGSDNPDPSARRNYIPIAFIPRQNPFYCALPYNDVTNGEFKPEAASVIPWFKQAYTKRGESVCWHRWVAIRKGARTCYAQWEDCGPFRTDHFQYVFGNERPKPNANHGAGLSVSPAVRDYLGLAPTDVTDWQFVEVRHVPPGPWRSYGENNHFVIPRRVAEEKSQAAVPTPSP